MRLIDRVGHRYVRLTVLERAPNASATDTNARWHCKCDCGRDVIAYGQDLAKGKVKSCGCLNAERIQKHGMARSRVYGIWKGMHQRCSNPKQTGYENYGGRGIKVDPAWNDFEVFFADMGEPEPDQTLERNNGNGPYSKANCRWATYKEQLNNTRRNRLLTAFGKTQTMAQWAEEYGLDWYTLRSRIKYGWPIEDALTEPIMPGKKLGNR